MSEELEAMSVLEKRFDIPRSTLTRAARLGNLRAKRMGNQWVSSATAVREWLTEAKKRPGPRPGEGIGRPGKRSGVGDAEETS